MIASRVTKNEHGEPVLTVTVTGFHDAYRFADGMTRLQCEFAHHGRNRIASLRRLCSRENWEAAMDYFHGSGTRGYEAPAMTPVTNGGIKPAPFTERRCSCLPFEQSWSPKTPGWCASCGLPFATYSRAREVCLKTEGCLLLPDHEGECGGF